MKSATIKQRYRPMNLFFVVCYYLTPSFNCFKIDVYVSLLSKVPLHTCRRTNSRVCSSLVYLLFYSSGHFTSENSVKTIIITYLHASTCSNWQYCMKRIGWFTEMVQADVIVGEISTFPRGELKMSRYVIKAMDNV